MTIYVGVGKIDITPPIGVKMAGYAARLKNCDNIHDPLYAKSVVIKCNDAFFALVSLDLAGLDILTCSEIKDRVANYLKIPKSSIVITTTHTHSGPQTGRYGEDWVDKSWLDQMVKKAASCIVIAANNLKEALIGYGEGEIYTISENRREKEGPIDPKIRVIVFYEKISKSSIVTLVNFSMHPVVLRANNTSISADYPGYLCDYLEKWEGGTTIFLQGTCGDIRPTILGTEDIEKSFKKADKVGKILAAEALKVKEQIDNLQHCRFIRIKSVDVSLNTTEFPPLSVALRKIKTLEKEILQTDNLEKLKKINWELYAMRRLKFLLTKRIHNRLIHSILTYIEIGELVRLLTLPGEPLVRFGFRLRRLADLDDLIIVGYSNDYIGYIPSIEDYRKGGYEATIPWCILDECGIRELETEAHNLLKTE